MKKIRSRKLWQYLSEAGLLQSSEEEISLAKAQYRREYKRVWKRDNQLPRKDVRPSFTLKQYAQLQKKALELGMTPTALITELALASIHAIRLLPQRDTLQTILQHVCMASVALSKERTVDPKIIASLHEAEQLLTDYLHA